MSKIELPPLPFCFNTDDECQPLYTIQQLREDRRQIVELCASQIPTSWLDPLLTGPRAVVGKPPYTCADVERLLSGVAAAIRALLDEKKENDRG